MRAGDAQDGPREQRDIKVTDRRASGGAQDSAASAVAEGAHPPAEDRDDAARPAPGDYPPIDFNTFVLSLSASALLHMGESPDGQPSKENVENLALARQTVDLLGVLEEKTRGNLTGEEERLLTQVLFDLRMRYIGCRKAIDRAGAQ